MADEAGSEVVSAIQEHVNNVKQALISRSNMEKIVKEEAINSVSEINLHMSKLSGMLEVLEKSLKKALVVTEQQTPRTYSEQLATSLDKRRTNQHHPQSLPAPRGDRGNQSIAKMIIKPANPNTLKAADVRKLLKEKID